MKKPQTKDDAREPLDERCAAGMHSWIDRVGRLPASTRCDRCGERYGHPD